ncbi:MAG: CRISPR-associated helicase/endonuclease Cas3 [Porticoccaceae bacterium]|nr:MAG: CRISPR-associated helicase/endonuclease Cas3 [Porticoccaceae bacterium]
MRRPLTEAQGAPLTAQQLARLAVIAFLHDFGKCNFGFQAKADPEARETAGHVLEALALLWELQDVWPPQWTRLITDIAGWFRDEEQALQMLVASLSHHGRPVSWNDYGGRGGDTAARWWRPTADYDPLGALDELARAARQAFPDAFTDDVPPIDATPEFQQRSAGLVMLADWIGSDTQFFPYRHGDEARQVFARKAAERALRAIGLVTPEPRTVKPFDQIFPFQPTALQKTLAETLAPSDETRLLLAESDTGSGKTEAALAWFFRLYAEGKVDGLYFALPTRVAARELYERARRAVDAAFESDARPGPVLLAAPGYVKVDGAPVLPAPQGTIWDDSEPDHKRERLWSAERPKRFLAAPIAVGTIDQALLSVLQVKHSLLRSVCLDRHLLVVDEVHASDPYMREVLRALLQGHVGRGGWALLLSATLGESAAAKYFERDMASLAEAIARPYPLLSSRNRAWPMPAARERQIAVELSPTLTDDEALIPPLIAALQAGARVLIVCNTVARANALFRRVESALEADHPELLPALFALDGVRCPHHGRFAREDRERLDAAVTAQFGKGSPDGARLIIGTQTLEQSLDIDADWLVTDLAPMDVLIQRLGRLHRHAGRARPPGFEAPRALVRVPDKELSSYLDKNRMLRAPAGLGRVYADGRVLACTWAELRRDPLLVLPKQARERIERTTHPEAFQALDDAWQKHGREIEGLELGELRQALRSVLDDKPFGELHYPDQGERVLTRLGDPTYDIPLETPMRSPFGADIGRVAIPARWLEGATVPESVRAEPTPDGFRFAIGHQRFRYTRLGLEKDDA